MGCVKTVKNNKSIKTPNSGKAFYSLTLHRLTDLEILRISTNALTKLEKKLRHRSSSHNALSGWIETKPKKGTEENAKEQCEV